MKKLFFLLSIIAVASLDATELRFANRTKAIKYYYKKNGRVEGYIVPGHTANLGPINLIKTLALAEQPSTHFSIQAPDNFYELPMEKIKQLDTGNLFETIYLDDKPSS